MSPRARNKSYADLCPVGVCDQTLLQLYLLGGLDDHDEPVHCVESYDPSYSEGGVVGEWMELQPLTSRRRLMAVASVGN